MLKTPQECIHILKEYGFNQSEIGRLCGISQGTVFKIMMNVTAKPNYVVVDKLREVVKTMNSKMGAKEMIVKSSYKTLNKNQGCSKTALLRSAAKIIQRRQLPRYNRNHQADRRKLFLFYTS